MKLGEVTSLTQYYVEHSGLSNFEIESFKRIFEENKNLQQDAMVGGIQNVNPDIRISEVVWLNDELSQKYQCQDTIMKIYNTINSINERCFKFDLQFTDTFQITRYDESNQGFYRPHCDTDSTQGNVTRKLSFVIQLSDLSEFEGGDFVYFNETEYLNLRQDFPQSLSKGNVIVFPSFIPHGVMPVTKGTRYSLVGWCKGPRFK